MIGEKTKAIKWLIDQPDGEYEVKKYHPRRGARANRYFHRICGILAKGETKPFDVEKNELIIRYGNREFVRDEEGKPVYHILPDNDEWKNNAVYHYLPTEYTDEFRGVKTRAFLMLQGTHTYTSLEMYNLIQGARAECEGSGVPREEYETPEELRLFEGLKK